MVLDIDRHELSRRRSFVLMNNWETCLVCAASIDIRTSHGMRRIFRPIPWDNLNFWNVRIGWDETKLESHGIFSSHKEIQILLVKYGFKNFTKTIMSDTIHYSFIAGPIVWYKRFRLSSSFAIVLEKTTFNIHKEI